MNHWWIGTLFLGICIAGCGSEPPPPPTKAPTPELSSPPPQAAASAPKRSAPPQRTTAATTMKSRPDVPPEQELTHNHFQFTPEPVLFEVNINPTAAANKPVTILLPKYDSRRVLIQKPERIETLASQGQPSLSLPKGFTWLPEEGLTSQGIPHRIRCEADGSVMAFIPGGVFLFGIDLPDSNASPQINVYVSPFYIDTHETTVEQYLAFQKSNSEIAKPRNTSQATTSDQQQLPALGIPFNDAQKYATWAGKDLPTEAEWERAARGPEGALFPWGNGHPLRIDGFLEPILPIGSRPTDLNQSGLYDMAGNAREWVKDWYSPTTHEKLAATTETPSRNPEGPRFSTPLGERVVKGSRHEWSLWVRDHANVKRSADDIGFRSVLRITDDMLPTETTQAAVK